MVSIEQQGLELDGIRARTYRREAVQAALTSHPQLNPSRALHTLGKVVPSWANDR